MVESLSWKQQLIILLIFKPFIKLIIKQLFKLILKQQLVVKQLIFKPIIKLKLLFKLIKLRGMRPVLLVRSSGLLFS
jgi:hypothetical protein